MVVERIFVPDSPWFLQKALQVARQNAFACWLNGNDYSYPQGCFGWVLGWGSASSKITLEDFLSRQPEDRPYMLGYLGYDHCQGSSETQGDTRPIFLGFPEEALFVPEVRIEKAEGGWHLFSKNPGQSLKEISCSTIWEPGHLASFHFQHLTKKTEYLKQVETVQERIREGDVYELNLCQYLESDSDPDGLSAYWQLNKRSPMPFSGWMMANEVELACGSPERFLRKKERELLTQPIKGTAPRGKNPEEDAENKKRLVNSEKERAENMMIVDLMRNDLARISETGSVEVPEIFGIYSFPGVHQMISTVRSKLLADVDFGDIYKATFPMGSMTGAPKQEVMYWIRQLEPVRRGGYSGCLGYWDGSGDSDTNVLIRTLFIHHGLKRCGLAVGSAITIDSDPEQEWEECGTKAGGILSLFGSSWEETLEST
jgi:para-aminobenzoate synthetase component 1